MANLLQSERHVQYFDTFVCLGVIKVKINSLIYCSTFSVCFTIFTPLSFQVRSQFNLHFNSAKKNLYMMTSLMINLKF